MPLLGSRLPLAGLRTATVGVDPGLRYAARLLARLGTSAGSETTADLVLDASGRIADAAHTLPAHPDDDWAASGAMALTGRAGGPPLSAPGAPATSVRGALLAFESLVRHRAGDRFIPFDVRLLGERAARAGFRRQGPCSADGSFRLLSAADGYIGIAPERPEAVAALTGRTDGDVWAALSAWAVDELSEDAVAAAQQAGLTAVRVGTPGIRDDQLDERWGEGDVGPFLLHSVTEAGPLPTRQPTVAVLSDDWASVLCGRLLAAAGAETTSEVGEKNVDIVIDGGRSVVDPYGLLTECPGLTWVSITPFGRTGPWAAHPGSGDAAAASAGLVAWDDGTGEPVPCGDAVAEPITGVHAAVAAYASWLGGGGRLVDIALREVAVTALELGADGLSRQGVPVAEPYAD